VFEIAAAPSVMVSLWHGGSAQFMWPTLGAVWVWVWLRSSAAVCLGPVGVQRLLIWPIRCRPLSMTCPEAVLLQPGGAAAGSMLPGRPGHMLEGLLAVCTILLMVYTHVR
jgi:hypothetical protein